MTCRIFLSKAEQRIERKKTFFFFFLSAIAQPKPPRTFTNDIIPETNFAIIGRKRTLKILLYASQRVCLIHIRISIVGAILVKLSAFEVDELEVCKISDEVIAAYAIWYKSYTTRTIIHILYRNITSVQSTIIIYIHHLLLEIYFCCLFFYVPSCPVQNSVSKSKRKKSKILFHHQIRIGKLGLQCSHGPYKKKANWKM